MIFKFTLILFSSAAPCGKMFVDFTRGASSPTMLTAKDWPFAPYECLWLLIAEEGNRIVLLFKEFELYQQFEYLLCGNGDGSEDAFIKLTG